MTTENLQVFSRVAFAYFFLFYVGVGGEGKYYDVCYFLSVNQNVKDIFIDVQRRKKQQKEKDISKSIKKGETLIKLLRTS